MFSCRHRRQLMSDPRTDEAVLPPLRSLIELFAGELADVKFPGIERRTLDEAAGQVRVRVAELARAEALVEEAKRNLEASQEGLLAVGHRALAYARIYAEDNAELA